MKPILTAIIFFFLTVSNTAAVLNLANHLCFQLDDDQHRAEHKRVYLGCFKDSNTKRAVPDDHIQIPYMTTEICHIFCKSKNKQYLYFSTQYSSHCFCGKQYTTYDRYGKVRDAECNMQCSGYYREMCGGPARNSVYRMQYP